MFNPPLCWPINGIWSRGSLPPQPHTPSFLPTSWLHLLSLLSYLLLFPGDNRIPQSLIFGLFSFYHTLFFLLVSHLYHPYAHHPHLVLPAPISFMSYSSQGIPNTTYPNNPPIPPKPHSTYSVPQFSSWQLHPAPHPNPSMSPWMLMPVFLPHSTCGHQDVLLKPLKQIQNLNMSHHAHCFLSYSS